MEAWLSLKNLRNKQCVKNRWYYYIIGHSVRHVLTKKHHQRETNIKVKYKLLYALLYWVQGNLSLKFTVKHFSYSSLNFGMEVILINCTHTPWTCQHRGISAVDRTDTGSSSPCLWHRLCLCDTCISCSSGCSSERNPDTDKWRQQLRYRSRETQYNIGRCRIRLLYRNQNVTISNYHH